MEPRTIVRRFTALVSDQLDAAGSGSTLQVLVAEDHKERQRQEQPDAHWREYFEPWDPRTMHPDELLMKTRYKDLCQAWSEFHDKLPSGEKARFEDRAPTFDDVVEVMTQVQARWDKERKRGGFGAIRDRYRRCCRSIKSHETMLKILPDGNEYVCIFSGVLKSIVQATENHERIAEDLAQAIQEVSDTVQTCVEIRHFYDTAKVQGWLMVLYAEIFVFLREVLEWYQQKRWKRVVQSFNESLHKDFQSRIDEIAKVAQKMKDAMFFGLAAEVRVGRMGIDNVGSDLADLQIRQRRNEEEVRYMRERTREQMRAIEDAQERKALLIEQQSPERQKELAHYVVSFLKATFTEQVLTQSLEQLSGGLTVGAPVVSNEPSKVSDLTREQIIIDSRHLEDHFRRSRTRIPADPIAGLSAPDEVSGRLRNWTLATESQILSIEGPGSAMHSLEPGPISKLAANIVALTEMAKLPVISYFCELERNPQLVQGETRQSKELVAMLYSVIRQTIELLPATFEGPRNFGQTRFMRLDGTSSTWTEAMAILKDLSQYAPPVCYYVIDGIQWLDDRSTSESLHEFVGMLQHRSAQSPAWPGVRKILLTTSGPSRCVLRLLSRKEHIHLDESVMKAALRGGRGSVLHR